MIVKPPLLEEFKKTVEENEVADCQEGIHTRCVNYSNISTSAGESVKKDV